VFTNLDPLITSQTHNRTSNQATNGCIYTIVFLSQIGRSIFGERIRTTNGSWQKLALF
jgi:hypothetical protein